MPKSQGSPLFGGILALKGRLSSAKQEVLRSRKAGVWGEQNCKGKKDVQKKVPPRPKKRLREKCLASSRELRNIYHHHHPESKKRKSSEGSSGSIHPYGRYGNAGKTSQTISTRAIIWPVKAIFEKMAATVEVGPLISPEFCQCEGNRNRNPKQPLRLRRAQFLFDMERQPSCLC